MTRTSGCTPRAMRVHAAQRPHASPSAGARQLIACASATAVVRLPTPEGPANSRLGGSVPPATERLRRLVSRLCPRTSRRGIVPACYHALAAALLLGRGWRLGLVVLFRVGIPADAEHARPEAALLFWRRLRRDVDLRRRRRDAARRRRDRRDGRIVGARRRPPVLGGAEQPGHLR